MVAQTGKFIRAHVKADISMYRQESNYTTWCFARMNPSIRAIDSGQITQGNH